MVLQQNTKVLFWGWSEPGEEISVQGNWQSNLSSTVADTTGKWILQLDSPSAGGPYHITIAGKNKIVLHDVLAGEVWFASGQSNMAMPVKRCKNAKSEIAASKYPKIRLFHVEHTLAEVPQQDCAGSWEYCNAEHVENFSGVAYFFGRHLYKTLNSPIGLISASKGGSPAEAWLRKEDLEIDSELSKIFMMWKKWEHDFPTDNRTYQREYDLWERKKGQTEVSSDPFPEEPAIPVSVEMIKRPHRRPGALYNSMVAPIIPYVIKGVIWYQGENNVDRPYQYIKLFPALIKSWRNDWGLGDFPFYYVQLAPYRYKNQMTEASQLREAQTMAMSLANTGMVVTTDIGELNDIHPKNKQEVGRRLALCALAKTYGYNDIVCSGPEYTSMNIEDDKIRLHFRYIGSGLMKVGDKLCSFEIANMDGKYFLAQANISDSTVIVFSKKVKDPQAVRYGWDMSLEPNLFNKDGLPAVPFRTHPNL
jgi:hypothetical protein